MGRPKALITGITGQDGSYLAELLLSKGYEVHGLIRRVALEDPTHRLVRIADILGEVHLHAGSLESFPSIHNVMRAVEPDECYHLAAQSFVSYSFDDEFSTLQTNINGNAPCVGGDQRRGAQMPLLFCRFQRNVRQGGGDAAGGNHPLSSTVGLWGSARWRASI